MRPIGAAALVASGVLLGASLQAQTRPSFAGTWAFQADGDTSPGFLCGTGCTIAQDAGALVVTRHEQATDIIVILALDGSETSIPTTLGGQSFVAKAKARWIGSRLSLVTVSDVAGRTYTITTELYLDEHGGLIIERVVLGVPGQSTAPMKTRYRRLPAISPSATVPVTPMPSGR